MLNDYLKNKKVVLVGPAAYLHNSKKMNFIDSFDVVVRLNNGYNISEERIQDLGSRTDVLYHCFWGPHFPQSIPFLTYPNIEPFSTDLTKFNLVNQNRVPFEVYDLELYLKLFNLLNSRPNTGTCAIYDLINSQIKSLHVCGITMFKGGYIKGYRKTHVFNSRKEVELENNIHKNHDIGNQIKFLKNIFKDERVTLDKEVRDSIYE